MKGYTYQSCAHRNGLHCSIANDVCHGNPNLRCFADTQIINLTPHAINLMPDGPDGSVITVPPSGQIARCSVDQRSFGFMFVDGVTVPIHQNKYGTVVNLPDTQPDTIYVVSALVAQAVPDRPDVFIVDDAVRDNHGRIIGAKALAHV